MLAGFLLNKILHFYLGPIQMNKVNIFNRGSTKLGVYKA